MTIKEVTTEQVVTRKDLFYLAPNGEQLVVPERAAIALGKLLETFRNINGRVYNLLAEDCKPEELQLLAGGVSDYIIQELATIQRDSLQQISDTSKLAA